jgi:hypothetical protein
MTQTTGREQFPSKKLGETITLPPIDFTAQMAPAETISTQVCTCSVYSGVDGSPGSVISGAATVSGQKVLQNVTGGVVGVVYNILCSITTSLGQTLQIAGYLAVTTNTP